MPQQPDGFSLAHQTFPYATYSLNVKYSWSAGVEDAAISYTQGGVDGEVTSEGVRVFKPQGRKVVTFEMVRLGAPPQIPIPDSPSSNEELLDVTINLHDRKVSADGRHYTYGASGTYVYRLARPIFPTDGQWPLGSIENGYRQPLDTFQEGGFED